MDNEVAFVQVAGGENTMTPVEQADVLQQKNAG
jgi:hypothetical protein